MWHSPETSTPAGRFRSCTAAPRAPSWSLLTMLGLLSAGCGGGEAQPVPVAPVSGQVTLDGEPLAEAQVLFLPQGQGEQELSSPSRGVTDSQGHYSLTLELDGRAGALLGKHRVEIRAGKGEPPPPNELGLAPPAPADRLPSRYNESSELSLEISAGGTDQANFSLKSEGAGAN